MTEKAKPWAPGDPCPACTGDLKPVAPPTDAQRAAAANRDNPTPLPPTVDHADPAQIRELGDLHRCGSCGYSSRVPADHDDDAPAAADADTKAPRRRSRARATTGE